MCIRDRVNIAGQATLRGDAQIRLGDTGGDLFNAGSININSNNHIDIFENSSMLLVGTNTAGTADLTSFGDIEDGPNASFNVVFTAGFFGDNVYIGDTDTDEFNAGTLYFEAFGDMFINEDSGTNIVERKNFANRLMLSSPLSITDDDTAAIEVTTLAPVSYTHLTLPTICSV